MANTFDAPVPTAVMWSDDLLKYRFNETHPMAPIRLDLTHRLAESFDVLSKDHVTILEPPVATDEELATVHSEEYIDTVKNASAEAIEMASLDADKFFDQGLGTEDCPIFADLHESAARIAGGTLRAAKAIYSGDVRRAVNFSGGMHHAMRDKASGFCIYNDAALAIQYWLDQGVERVAYIDLDAHHGDGVESIFWDDPRVMTISVHESGLMLFPGTGFARDIGGDNAQGSAVNVALSASVGDAAFLRAVHATVPQLLRQFKPQILVTQHGCDGHRTDPLADLNLTVDGQRQLMLDVMMWSEDYSQGRWLALGGGGYSPFDVVPRAWTHLVAIATGDPISLTAEISQEWREYAAKVSGKPIEEIAKVMNDNVDIWWRSWEVGYDPSDPNDQSIMATRKEIFPLHGLDPWFD